MYLFSGDRTLLKPKQIPSHFHLSETCKGALLWCDDRFTRVTQSAKSVVLEVMRPEIDRQPVCILEWDLSLGRLRQSRAWSGEFSAHFSGDPLIVASHAKLVATVIKRPVRLHRLPAGAAVEGRLGSHSSLRMVSPKPPKISRMTYAETVQEVRRLVMDSVARCARGGAELMLSGGVDSSIVAAAGTALGFKLRSFTYAPRRPPRPEHADTSDRLFSARVAAHLGIPHHVIEIDAKALRRNVPLAIYLAETSRGTIVDELAAHIEVARFLCAAGVDRLLTGEGADDLFGAFPSTLRRYRGHELARFLRRELIQGLPDELAELQQAYAPWGVALVHPYWTEELRAIGYGLRIPFRIDRRRLMKRVLRDAFADLLPPDVIERPKGVPRDCAQIRDVLEARFGGNPNRYRPILRTMMLRRLKWPAGLPPLPKNSNECAPK